MLSDGSRGNAEGAEPFDTLTVNGFPPLMVSLSNHAHSAALSLCGEKYFGDLTAEGAEKSTFD